jgi:hypothetical protein
LNNLPALAAVFQKIGLKKICAIARYNEIFEKSMRADIVILEKKRNVKRNVKRSKV